jgi:GT2 family glycosyltransferase
MSSADTQPLSSDEQPRPEQGDGQRVLMITPAHNEAAFLPALIDAVRKQTRPPEKWVVVDDVSSDATPRVLREAAASLPYLEVVTREQSADRSFGAKAHAVMSGWERARCGDISVIACVDADVVLPVDFIERVLAAFRTDARLGVTGARYQQRIGGRVEGDGGPPEHVPGAAQVFRREVFDAIGGYRPLPNGGIDSVANVAARVLGWRTRTVDGLVVDHLRPEGTANWSSQLKRLVGRGRRDYDVGNLPLFELAKLLRRINERPWVIGSTIRLAAYCVAAVRRLPRPVDPALVAQLRREQRQTLRTLFTSRRLSR